MLFYSWQFFIFLPLVLLVYFIIPGKWRVSWLLLTSYIFYFCFHPNYVFVLLAVTLISYFAGRRLDRAAAASDEEAGRQKKRIVFWAGAGSVLALLLVFKYTGFVLENINRVLGIAGVQPLSLPFSLILPAGISYFTFQMISYLADIYRGKRRAEQNFLYFALYVSFFPKIIAGPIERAEFLGQIRDCRSFKLWDAGRMEKGFSLMVWGYFEKLVIADRLAMFVEEVFRNYSQYGSVELLIGATLFYLQIYADFVGCMHMAMGMAKIMGFSLQENFNAPYFSRSVREYWARWHISLSTWLKDYIYIPLGGNRRGSVYKYRNLMLTFLVSGLWHGASWNFVLWGGIHGVYQVLENITMPFTEKLNEWLHTKKESFSYKLLQVGRTWLMIILAFVFFKLPTAKDSFLYLRRMFTKWNPWVLFDGSLYTLGISEKYFDVVLVSLLLFFLVDFVKYKKQERIDVWLAKQCIWFRFLALLGCIMAVVIFGAYGPSYDAGNFIYFGF